MNRMDDLLKWAGDGDEESMVAILALLKPEIWEMSLLTENPTETYNTLRSELVLAIRSRQPHTLIKRHKTDTKFGD
ncbi:MAG: hypothetical protein ACYCYO_21580 [Bacilli bacterium]